LKGMAISFARTRGFGFERAGAGFERRGDQF
jgi:hypothetical protein